MHPPVSEPGLTRLEPGGEDPTRQPVDLKAELLSIVSHELRNPLHTILMAAGTLLDIPLDDAERRRHLEIIYRSAGLMTRLLDDLLEVARLEAGHLPVSIACEDPGPMLEECCDALRMRAASAEVLLLLELTPELPMVLADRARVAQVLENLVGNAIKFTAPNGTVRVRAQPDGDHVRIAVADSGIGIAASDLPYIFDRFWQANRASRAGAGLGLAIVKGIVEAHAGRIWVESEEGKGSTFSFTLPAIAPRAD
ncbi:MAG TPA: HAMP domain-containing sensor histidine kinase [Gemmatimonadaceae bacterium]|nr:HAMP domain-containing sensor histidine kinase [Gemmatimonadaceae bacterium]